MKVHGHTETLFTTREHSTECCYIHQPLIARQELDESTQSGICHHLYCQWLLYWQYYTLWHQSTLVHVLTAHVLKGKLPQTTMWIGWGESNFTNPPVKVWADLDNPFKRSDYAKLCMSPSLDGTLPEYVISQEDKITLHWLCTCIDFHNFKFFLDINSLLIKFIHKCMHIHLSTGKHTISNLEWTPSHVHLPYPHFSRETAYGNRIQGSVLKG